MTERVTKLCTTCGRFRSYHADDRFCIGCGYETLADRCECGRNFDYALDEAGSHDLHCPGCGRDWRGRSPDL